MQAKAKTGCGCGGGCGGGGRAGCGCQPARLPEAAVCSSCETASFVRPRFFAGQLLTEDDLGALTDYIVAKNRFHNARLFGDGVVCGLEVASGPRDGQLVVAPGHALDCCGNDLVLTCEQTLDIAPLIRELAAHKDCGCTDPCLPTSSDQADSPRGPCTEYCLYARYAERSDQPVAAYPVSGNCDAASCEPTRIVEGIVFELRCPPAQQSQPTTFIDRATCCGGELEPDQVLTTAAAFQDLAARIRYWLTRPAAALTGVEIGHLRDGAQPEEMFRGATGGARVVALTRYLASVGGPFLRARLLGLAVPDGVDADQLEHSLARAADELRASYRGGARSPLEAEAAAAVLQSWDAARGAKPDLDAMPVAAFMHGTPVSPTLLDAARAQMTTVAKQLRSAMSGGAARQRADRALQAQLDGLTPTWRAKVEPAELERAANQLAEAAEIVRRCHLDCLCAAINPPCPACDDTGVLLACITVDRCKVVRICNTVRQFVLAPATLRYWDAIDVPCISDCCGHEDGERRQRGQRATELARRMRALRLPGLAGAGASPGTLREQLAPVGAAAAERTGEQEIAELRATLAELARRIADLERPEVAKPEVAKPEVAKPEVAKPEVAKPEVAKPEAAKPEAKSDAAKPDTATPEAATPEAAKSEVAKAHAARPHAARPHAAKPEAAKPDAAKPDAVKPAKEKP